LHPDTDAEIADSRTHRERKEQYIKGLETEISGLRERYVNDTIRMNNTLEQHRDALVEQQTENAILKEILSSRGIAFQSEFESRKAAMMMQHRNGTFPPTSASARSGTYGQISPTTGSTSGRSTISPPGQKYSNGKLPSISGASAVSGSFHGHSPAEPGISERAVKQEPIGIADMPGVFELDRQLGIDFILA
jgi:hypothetical protein